MKINPARVIFEKEALQEIEWVKWLNPRRDSANRKGGARRGCYPLKNPGGPKKIPRNISGSVYLARRYRGPLDIASNGRFNFVPSSYPAANDYDLSRTRIINSLAIVERRGSHYG